jgi:hypothetical protein
MTACCSSAIADLGTADSCAMDARGISSAAAISSSPRHDLMETLGI